MILLSYLEFIAALIRSICIRCTKLEVATSIRLLVPPRNVYAEYALCNVLYTAFTPSVIHPIEQFHDLLRSIRRLTKSNNGVKSSLIV